MIRKTLITLALAAAAVAAAVLPARAATGFAAADNGSVFVTKAPVTSGEVLSYRGTAETVTFVRTSDGVTEFGITGVLPGSDTGTIVVFVPVN